jgi:hypothetical protein
MEVECGRKPAEARAGTRVAHVLLAPCTLILRQQSFLSRSKLGPLCNKSLPVSTLCKLGFEYLGREEKEERRKELLPRSRQYAVLQRVPHTNPLTHNRASLNLPTECCAIQSHMPSIPLSCQGFEPRPSPNISPSSSPIPHESQPQPPSLHLAQIYNPLLALSKDDGLPPR